MFLQNQQNLFPIRGGSGWISGIWKNFILQLFFHSKGAPTCPREIKFREIKKERRKEEDWIACTKFKLKIYWNE